MNMSFLKSKAFWGELLRFLAVGIYGTLIDYVVEVWVTSFFSSSLTSNYVSAFFIQFGISLVGFLIALPSTWSLSAVWAFKDAEDKEGTRSAKGMAKFALFAFLGLLCGAIVQFLGYMTCIEWSGWGINILDIDFSTLFGSDVLVFWSYTVVFVLKTAATTIFNYVTRKFILYKTKTS